MQRESTVEKVMNIDPDILHPAFLLNMQSKKEPSCVGADEHPPHWNPVEKNVSSSPVLRHAVLAQQ